MTEPWTPSEEPTPTTPAEFHGRTRLRGGEILRIGIVIGSLVVLVASAAVTIGASPQPTATPATDAPGSSPATMQGAPGRDGRGPGWFFGGSGGFGGMFGGPGNGPSVGGRFGGGIGRSITIDKIVGSDVSLKTDDGWTRTITVGDSTQIRIGSQKGTLADLKVGDAVALNETKNSDGTYTVTLIVVRVPTIAGTVTDVSATGFSIKLRDGTTTKVSFSGSTDFFLGIAAGAKTDLSVGARVAVEGTAGSDSTFAASVVRIAPDVRSGKVTATSSSSITIQVRDGSTVTIHVAASTTFRVLGATTAKLADVTVGMEVMAQGTTRADGSLDAVSVFAGTLRTPKAFPVRPDVSPPAG